MNNTDTVTAHILATLGGPRFAFMTGAKLISRENELVIKLPRAVTNGVNHVTITLRPDRTFGISFAHFSGVRMTTTDVAVLDHVAAAELKTTFERFTGYRASL